MPGRFLTDNMYVKDYKDYNENVSPQKFKTDEVADRYNVWLKKTSVFAFVGMWAVVIMFIITLFFLSERWDSVWLIQFCFIAFIAWFITSNYRRDKKKYFVITKEGVDFCESAILKDGKPHQMTWDEIQHITLSPRSNSIFAYDMKVVDALPPNKDYSFPLDNTLNPETIVKILKDYSSGKVKIKFVKHNLFSTKTEWY